MFCDCFASGVTGENADASTGSLRVSMVGGASGVSGGSVPEHVEEGLRLVPGSVIVPCKLTCNWYVHVNLNTQ